MLCIRLLDKDNEETVSHISTIKLCGKIHINNVDVMWRNVDVLWRNVDVLWRNVDVLWMSSGTLWM